MKVCTFTEKLPRAKMPFQPQNIYKVGSQILILALSLWDVSIRNWSKAVPELRL